MFKLNKLHTDLFELISVHGETLVRGNFKRVETIGTLHGFTDLRCAKKEMEEHNHNCADFGMYKSFIFSYTDTKLFRLIQ